METFLIDTMKSLSDYIANFVEELISMAKFNKTYIASIISTDGKGNYKVNINQKEYSATSYFELKINTKAYAIAPNNNFSKLYLIPFRK